MNVIEYNSSKKLRYLLLNGLIFILVITMIQACGDDDDDNGTPTDGDGVGNVVEVAQSNDDFSQLVDALGEAGLVSTLEGDGPFTVFAPTNDAFNSLPEGFVDSLSNDQLAEVLSYHVVDSEIASGDLQSEQSVEALAGGQLFITTNGDVAVNDTAIVTSADIEASNGVIHAIDQVVLPDAYQSVVGIVVKRYELQSLEDAAVQANLADTLQEDTENGYTVFAPSNSAFEGVDLSGLSQEELQNILAYHVLPSSVPSSALDDSQRVETANGDSLTIEVADETVTLTDNAGESYEVTTADLEGTNGVVHIINGVLMPNEQ